MEGMLGDFKEVDGIFYPSSKISEKASLSYPSDGLDRLILIEDSSYWFWHRNQCIEYFVKKYCSEAIFLDVGGGNGPVTKHLQNSGMEAILIEPDNSGCQNAKSRGVEKIFSGELEDISFTSRSQPFSVGMFDVIEHIDDDKKVVLDVQQKLKEGEYFVLTVPSIRLLWSKADVHGGHYRRYTKKMIKRLLQNSGFEIIECHFLFSSLILPIFFFRVMPSLAGFYKVNGVTNSREHGSKEGLFSRTLRKLLGREFSRIKKGRSRSYGSSLLVVARKI